MQVSVEKNSELERCLTIVVPADEFEGAVSAKLSATRGSIRLPGFRPGKVPLKEVRRRFGAALRTETASELMRERFSQALAQEELEPAGTPTLDVVDFQPGTDFRFTATFEVFPQVELVDFSAFDIARPTGEVTESDIDDMVQHLREQHREWDALERGAQAGDRITLNFAATLDGEPVAGASGEGLSFEIGSGRMIEDFDQAVRGLATGEEKEFPASFPEDYGNGELAGKTLQFTVTVVSVEAPRLPEIDDAFFQAFGIDEGGEQAFREQVLSNMRRELDAAIRAQMKNRVMDRLFESHDIPLPKALVEQTAGAMGEEFLRRLGPRNKSSQPLPGDLFRERAQRQVALGLISREIASTRKLTVDPERIRKRIEELAEPYAAKDEMIAWYYQNEEQLAKVEAAVLEDQVVDAVLEQATVSVQERSYAEIMAGEPQATTESEQDERNKDE